MNCPSCRAALYSQETQYCPYCGYDLSTQGNQKIVPPEIVVQYREPPEPPRKNRKLIIVLLVLMLLAIAAFVVILLTVILKKDESDPDPGSSMRSSSSQEPSESGGRPNAAATGSEPESGSNSAQSDSTEAPATANPGNDTTEPIRETETESPPITDSSPETELPPHTEPPSETQPPETTQDPLEQIYRRASELFAQGSYSEAAALFSSLGNYADSEQMAMESEYQRGVQLMESGAYPEAADCFYALGGYRDSEEQRKESIYLLAMQFYARESYSQALPLLELLGDYKDAQSVRNRILQMTLLEEAGYLGDSSACRMSAEQALVFAELIRTTDRNVVLAALFDGGDGIPMLWIAWANQFTNGWGSYKAVLSGDFNDQIYCWQGGAAKPCIWITTVLKAGSGGTVVQTNKRETDMKFYRLEHGAVADAPYATASWDHSGEATLNGAYFGNGANLTIWSFYLSVEPEAEVLLESVSGTSDQLYLTGNWIQGEDMASLLEQYGWNKQND